MGTSALKWHLGQLPLAWQETGSERQGAAIANSHRQRGRGTVGREGWRTVEYPWAREGTATC